MRGGVGMVARFVNRSADVSTPEGPAAKGAAGPQRADSALVSHSHPLHSASCCRKFDGSSASEPHNSTSKKPFWQASAA